MGIENLIDSVCAVLRQIVRGMRLPVNIDNEFNEETADYPPERYEGPECDMDTESGMDSETDETAYRPKEKGEARWKAPEVFSMNLPERSDTISRVPYLLVQLLSGEDQYDKDTEDEHAKAKIRIIIATYNPDGEDGGMQVVRIIDAIRIAFQKGRLLNRQYMLVPPMNWDVYPDDTGVFYLGEINMTFSIPEIKRTAVTIEETLGQW